MTTEQTSFNDGQEENFYTVDIDEFEGPLELLLMLVKKKEVDIYDIPVANIAGQYNRKLEEIKEHSLDSAGRHLPFLAELGLIKSRMLLPKVEDEETGEEIDPRIELARRLVVYERFRDAALKMGAMNLLGRDVFLKGLGYTEEFGDPEVETEVAASGVWPLIMSLCEMRARINENDKEDITLIIDPISVEERIAEIHAKLKKEKVIENFDMLFEEKPSRSQVAVSFMAILELAKKEVVELFQKKPFSSIKLLYSEDKQDGEEPDKKSD